MPARPQLNFGSVSSAFEPYAEQPLEVGAEQLLDAFAKKNGDDEATAAEKKTALRALAYVLGRNFKAAEATEKDGVFSLTFRVTFDRNEQPTTVKAVARCSRISTADIELNCEPSEENS